MKKGIVELADVVVVTKADGDLLPAANLAKQEYMSALRYTHARFPEWQTKVLTR